MAPIRLDEWQEADRFTPEGEAEEPIGPAPAAARPLSRSPKNKPKIRKKQRTAIVTYASYVLLFLTVASLSAAAVLLFG